MRRLAAPKLSRTAIIRQAEDLIDSYVPFVGRKRIIRDGLRFEDVYEKVIYPEYEIDYDEQTDLGYDESGEKILGRFDVMENRAYIDRCLSADGRDPRRAFTLWHEIPGHGLLHGPWFRQQFADNSDYGIIETTEHGLLDDGTASELERQANLFAATAAAPMWLVDGVIEDVFHPNRAFDYFSPGKYWFDVCGISTSREVGSFADLCWNIGRFIRTRFGGLSAQALSYRIMQSHWVADRSRPRLDLHRVERASRRHEDFLPARARRLKPQLAYSGSFE